MIFVCLTGMGFVNAAELVKYRMQGDHDWPSGHSEMSTGESDQLSQSLSSCTEIPCENDCVGIRINQLTGAHKGVWKPHIWSVTGFYFTQSLVSVVDFPNQLPDLILYLSCSCYYSNNSTHNSHCH